MDTRQQRTMQSFHHVLFFLKQHPIKPEVPLVTRMATRLEGVITRLQELRTRQTVIRTPSGAIPTRVRHLRGVLRREMMALVRIAQVELAYSPAEAALKVPHARASAQVVADTAVAMADALAAHRSVLKDAGYPKEFLKEFRARAKALADWERDAAGARTERSLATREIGEALKEGMQAVTVIEGLVMRANEHQKDMMRLWKNRRRVSKRMGRPKVRKAPPN